MLSLKGFIGGMLAGLMLLTCVDAAHADRWNRRRRRHHGRRNVVVVPARTTVVRQAVVGSPVVYQTYSTYNPYMGRNYRYYDQGGYRYYRGNDNRVLGRVLTRAIAQSLR